MRSERLPERLLHVGEGLPQDLAGERVGGLVVGERGHDRALAAPLPLVLVEEGRDLDQVQEAGVVAPRPHPASRGSSAGRRRG